jgi:amino acid adenylation domain-containing protein
VSLAERKERTELLTLAGHAQDSSVANAALMLLATAEAHGDRVAVAGRQFGVDYRWLGARSLAFAEALADADIRPGDRVALLLPRGADAAAAFFGVLACGAVAVTVNETLRPRQIDHILGHSGAKALLFAAELLDRLPRPIATKTLKVDVSAVPAAGDARPVARIGSDAAQIVYTSGSTGQPKGVTISHANLWAGMQAVTAYLGIDHSDRIASLLPFSFDYGLNQLLCCAGTGATLVVEHSPVPQRIVQTLRDLEVTVLPAVPPLWLQLLGTEAFQAEPLPALRILTNTGGRLPTEAVRKLRRAQPHAALVLMYGLTEAFRSSYLPPDRADIKPTSIGRAIPGAELLVLRDDLTPCAPGEHGQLVHRGPTVALGYWNDPEATAKVFRPNPLRPAGTPDAERVVFSGDRVYRDDEGDLFFVGREDHLIKTLGYRVSPDEVADVLYASGEVVEAAVTSEPDTVRGARILAYVVLGQNGDLDRLTQFAARELPRYMQPARIEAVPALPRTTSGKHDAATLAKAAVDPR